MFITEQENKDLTDYRDFAIKQRGALINEVITLERMIDYFIACHLCQTEEKRQEICELILGTERMTFGGKKQVFEALRNKYYSTDIKTTKKIATSLQSIVNRRNRFAHMQLSTRIEDALHYKTTGEITFINFTNGIEFHTYSKERFQKYFDELYECMVEINEINKK